MIDLAALSERFQELYGSKPRLFRAPGRVNLIGEHTDYNDGFVLPVAIELGTVVAAASRIDRRFRVYSLNVNQECEFELDSSAPQLRGTWGGYVEGMARVLDARDVILRGADLLIESDVPLGAGLSSSAALEMSTGLAMVSLAGVELHPLALAQAGQQAEHEVVGTRCGIMDQTIALLGKPGHALLIDCRLLKTTPVPIALHDYAIVVCDTRVKHSLASSEYNTRRAECERGVELLRHWLPDIRALRDVSPSAYLELETRLPEPIRRRCRHVITENARTCDAAEALRVGDAKWMGRLMAESHQSLRDCYEVSCRELDVLVKIATSVEGVAGARMTGGGFGGSTVNLVRRDVVGGFCDHVSEGYNRAVGIEPAIYVSEASGGACEIDPTAGDLS